MPSRFDYSRMQNTAKRLFSKFQQGTVKLVRQNAPTPGPNEWDIPTPVDPSVYPLEATVSGVSKEYIGTNGVISSDSQVKFAVFETEPLPSDLVFIDNIPLTIIQVTRIPNAGIAIAWLLIVRG